MRKISSMFLTLGLLLLQLVAVPTRASAQTATPAPHIRITQVDNSKFPQVTVYVSVTDANNQPLGVDPSTIQVSENGQAVTPTTANGAGPTKGPGPLTTLLMVDVSGSMLTANKLVSAQKAAKVYVDQMRPGDQAGVVSFSDQVTVVQPLTADHQALYTAIDSLQASGDTAMFDALLQSEKLLKDVGGRKAIIVLTDGLDNRSKSNLDAVVSSIGPSGLTISTIGLGNPQDVGNLRGIDEVALKALAQKGGGLYSFAPEDPAALAAIYQQYGQNLQSEYVLTYVSSSKLRDGVNRALTVSLNGGATTASSQYNPGGVLPEVASQSWPLFAGFLLLLLALLALPMLVGRGIRAFGSGGGKKGRVKLSGEPIATPQRGRVKMK
jgi:Ca-activated chloride channel homolog